MPRDPITYKPKYNGSMRFAMILWPVWTGLAIYFTYRIFADAYYNPGIFLAIVFGIMAVTLPFRAFRAVIFDDKITVKRYGLPDKVIEYKDITEFTKLDLDGPAGGISLYMINPDSLKEFTSIIDRLISEKKIRLKTK